MTYRCTLKFPGTILHPKRGRIDLCKLSQKELKEFYEAGSAYIELVPGDPPCEKELEVSATPKKEVAKPNKPAKKSVKKETPPSTQPEESPE